MIAIINNGPFNDPDPDGERQYLVKINSQLIAIFRHRRVNGLAECLRAAARAVDKAEKTKKIS